MIGSMLFGRSGYAGTGSYGGFGFGDLIILLLLVGIVYYVVKRIRARKQALEGAGYSNYSYTEPAYDTAYSGHTEQKSPVFSGLTHIAQTDPSFDEARFKETPRIYSLRYKVHGREGT